MLTPFIISFLVLFIVIMVVARMNEFWGYRHSGGSERRTQ